MGSVKHSERNMKIIVQKMRKRLETSLEPRIKQAKKLENIEEKIEE